MQRQNVLKPMMAAALTLSSIIPAFAFIPSRALADDYDNGSNGRYDYCYRFPNARGCDNQNRDWRNSNGQNGDQNNQNRDWRNSNGQNGDWNNQNRDWRNSNGQDNSWNNRNGSRNNRREDLRISSGISIPTRATRKGRIVLRRGERYAYQLIADRDLRSDSGSQILIPRGSTIEGSLVPYRDGYRFESDYVTLRNGGREKISAVSNIIDSNNRYGRSINDSVLSPAASVILGTLLGRPISTNSDSQWGGIFDRDSRARRDLVVINSSQDLDLRLDRTFTVSYR